jgi:predicted acyltransferase
MALGEQAMEAAASTMTGDWAERALPWSVGLPQSAALPRSAALPQTRLLSLDFMRGFTMFWIIGGSQVAIALVGCIYPPLTDAVETQLMHARWRGFTALDMVMPMFLFMVGAALPLALAKRLEPGQPLRPVYARIARRVAMLWVLGILTQMMKQFADDESVQLELFSNTLQGIAVGYLVTSLALIHLRVKGQIVLLASLIVGYLALVEFVPFGGHPAGTFQRHANLPRYVDMLLLGVFRRDHSFTWIVTSLGFSASVLMGAMAGHLLRSGLSTRRRLLSLVAIGSVCAVIGWCWSYSLPLNRHLWSSSTILWAGGWSFLVLALFHAVIDVAGARRWTFPFVIIGSNALLAYVLQPFFGMATQGFWSQFLPDGFPELPTDLLTCGSEVVLLWLVLCWLFRNRLFLRA